MAFLRAGLNRRPGASANFIRQSLDPRIGRQMLARGSRGYTTKSAVIGWRQDWGKSCGRGFRDSGSCPAMTG